MNTFYLGVIIILLTGLIGIYILSFRKHVYQILRKENIDCSKNVERFSAP